MPRHHTLKIILLLLFLIVQFISAQDSLDTYKSDEEIIVTASRVPTAFSDIARTVSVIELAEIQSIPAQSVPELLENILGVDVQQRGTQGIQADVSIRGAGFNQTLVLLNGLKLSDPQTGHHNMNLPVDISDIERIEVLKGPGSRLYGPNAFGGVLNIITKKSDKLQATIGGLYGEHNLYNSRLNINLPLGPTNNRVTVSKYGSDGYINNSDFQNLNISHSSTFNLDAFGLELSSGFNKKSFGANTFYTSRFPDQYEATILRFVQSGVNFSKENLYLKAQGFLRSHYDNFTLFRSTPELYTNIHRTNSYGTEFYGSYNSTYGISLLGAEISYEEIDSNNLGVHNRTKSGLFLQQQIKINSLLLSLGASAYNYSEIGWKTWPGVDASYRINDNSKLHSSISYGFRVPTYTELYYSDPATRGNDNLESEESVSYELGYSYWNEDISTELTLFQRTNNNMIDYVLNEEDNLYHAQNFTEIQTFGTEFRFEKKYHSPLKSIFLNYAYLDSRLDHFGKATRYTLTHFKHQLIMGINNSLPIIDGMYQSWKIRYEEKLIPSKYTLIDTRIFWKSSDISAYLDVTNILNITYFELPSVKSPGRWVKLGFEYNLL